MTTLTVYANTDASQPLLHTEDHATITAELARVGVPLQRWEARAQLADDATSEQVFDAYAPQIAELSKRYGIQSIDVVAMHPAHEQAPVARGKFLAEHTHDDFELRFFVDGAGAFYIHADGKVFQLVCTKGDLIELPADVTHWFDMGEKPFFKAIRFFTKPDGWVGRFTGSEIAKGYPEYRAAERGEH